MQAPSGPVGGHRAPWNALFRRVRDVPLEVPAPGVLEVPDPAVAHKRPGDVWRAADASLRRVSSTDLTREVARYAELLGPLLGPYVDVGEEFVKVHDDRELDRGAKRVEKPIEVCARLGSAFARVEEEQRPLDATKSDAVFAAALAFSSFLHTQVGPAHLGYYMWLTARTSYYLTRRGHDVDPVAVLPSSGGIANDLPELADVYRTTAEAVRLEWNSLIEPRSAPS